MEEAVAKRVKVDVESAMQVATNAVMPSKQPNPVVMTSPDENAITRNIVKRMSNFAQQNGLYKSILHNYVRAYVLKVC